MPKKYTTAQLTGERGISLVQDRVLEMGHVFQPTGDLEAGIDGFIEIRDPETEAATNLTIAVQSKATKGQFVAETEEKFQYTVDERDLEYWLSGNLPVLLVVSRPDENEIYYKSIKDYFRDPERRKDRKITFDKAEDRFDESIAESLVDLAAPEDSGLYVNPVPDHEELISNLLPVRDFAETVYHAETDYRHPGEVWEEVAESGLALKGDWILWNKRIWSVRDTRSGPLSNFCYPETTEDERLDRWAQSDDPDLRSNFVKLMYQCLRQRFRKIRVGYDKDKNIYYFWSTRDNKSKKVDYVRHNGNESYRTVFKGYPDDSDEKYFYRHMALYASFERINGEWHLEIDPTYLFTTDGHNHHPGGGKLLSNVRKDEGHTDVSSQVQFWAYQLLRTDFESTYPYLSFQPLRTFMIDKGIDDERWRSPGSIEEIESQENEEDNEPESQYDLFDSQSLQHK